MTTKTDHADPCFGRVGPKLATLRGLDRLRPALTGTADSFPNEVLGLGGVNLEGKEFVFEPNSQDEFGASTCAATVPTPTVVMIWGQRSPQPQRHLP